MNETVIKRLSADDQRTFASMQNEASKLNNVLSKNPFMPLHSSSSERVVNHRDGLFYTKIEQRSAQDRRFEFYAPDLINHLDKSDPVKTRSFIHDHAELTFDDRCPEPFIVARLIEFMIENKQLESKDDNIAQLLGTMLETCANRRRPVKRPLIDDN